MMEIQVKNFSELTVDELYELLRLRSEVFVVEQNCVYQDIDNKDQLALHILGVSEQKLVAYTRCFPPGIYFEEAAIGRVVVADSARGTGLGHSIMEASLTAIKKRFNTTTVKLSAQTYLKDFYTTHGFSEVGEEYLEDGIPHIAMLLKA